MPAVRRAHAGPAGNPRHGRRLRTHRPDPHQRLGGRPASLAVRSRLPGAGGRQDHLRHRRLRPDSHRRTDHSRPGERPAGHRRLAGRRQTGVCHGRWRVRRQRRSGMGRAPGPVQRFLGTGSLRSATGDFPRVGVCPGLVRACLPALGPQCRGGMDRHERRHHSPGPVPGGTGRRGPAQRRSDHGDGRSPQRHRPVVD